MAAFEAFVLSDSLFEASVSATLDAPPIPASLFSAANARKPFFLGTLCVAGATAFALDSSGAIFGVRCGGEKDKRSLKRVSCEGLPALASICAVDSGRIAGFDGKSRLFVLGLISAEEEEEEALDLQLRFHADVGDASDFVLRAVSVRGDGSLCAALSSRTAEELFVFVADPRSGRLLSSVRLSGHRPLHHAQFASDGSRLALVCTSDFAGPNAAPHPPQQQQQLAPAAAEEWEPQQQRAVRLLAEEWDDEDDDDEECEEDSRQPSSSADDDTDARVLLFDVVSLPLGESPVRTVPLGACGELMSAGPHPDVLFSSIFAAVRSNVACKVLELDLSSALEISAKSAARFEALGYVASGKRLRRFLVFNSGWTHAALVEAARFVYVYTRPVSGQKHAPYQLFEFAGATFRAAEWCGNVLLLQTDDRIIFLSLKAS